MKLGWAITSASCSPAMLADFGLTFSCLLVNRWAKRLLPTAALVA